MAKTNFDYQEDRTVPTATGIMSPFTNLKENTDGTTGKIEGLIHVLSVLPVTTLMTPKPLGIL